MRLAPCRISSFSAASPSLICLLSNNFDKDQSMYKPSMHARLRTMYICVCVGL